MKKRISVLVALVAILGTLLAVFTGCARNRENTLRIANWGEYMSEETYNGFVEWYKEKTGEDVTVDYKEFDTNENLYTWIATKHDDYDLICPSDYMLQRMIKEDLLLELDAETKEVLNAKINPTVINMVKGSYDPDFKYTMPYVWGTLGIMFNTSSDGQAGLQNELDTYSSWTAFWNDSTLDSDGNGKAFMKNSVRDAYTVAMLYAKREQLKTASNNYTDYSTTEYQNLLKQIFAEANDETVQIAKTNLLAQKKYVMNYEVDSGKDDMLLDTNKGYFGLFWSCDAGYVMSDESANAKRLYYTVPIEGGNVWVDGFAISKYAKNTKAANYFIQYLCEKEVGYDCMDYVGSTTAVAESAEQYKADLLANEEFFEGTYDGFKEMYIDMMFPSEETLKRCAIMIDFGEYNEKLDQMWMDIGLSE